MTDQSTYPIGILDSGIGGLTIWREIIDLLPNESTLYYGDSVNCPYGTKSISEIKSLAITIIDFLLGKNAKIIVVACNTISVTVVNDLRKIYSVPIVAIEPATKVAAANTKTGNIGILATEGTFKGELFNSTKDKYANGINVYVQPGYGLAELVEQCDFGNDNLERLLRKYLEELIEKEIDQLVLGCTHYPFLIKNIKAITGDQITIIDPSEAVAMQVKRQLEEYKLAVSNGNSKEYIFYTTGKSFPIETLLPEVSMDEIKIHYI